MGRTFPHRTRLPHALLAALSLTACGKDQIVDPVMPASIALDRTTVSFTVTEGGADPEPVTVTVGNAGDEGLGNLQASVSYEPGQSAGWLGATLSASAAPAMLTLAPTAGGLAAGTYQAEASVSAADAENSPQSVSVVLTVTAAPPAASIALSSTSVTFNMALGGESPSPRGIDVTNQGEGSLTGLEAEVVYDPGAQEGWLDAALASATAPSALTLTVDGAGLATGLHEAEVLVRSPAADNSPRSIDVALLVEEELPDITVAGSFGVTPASVRAGEAASPSEITFRNQGAGTAPSFEYALYLSVDAVITADDEHLATAAVAELLPGQELVKVPGPVVIPAETPAGDYYLGILADAGDGVTESNEDNNHASAPLTVLPPPPAIALSTSSVQFTAQAGGSDPLPRQVGVTNGGGGRLEDLDVEIRFVGPELAAPWLEGAFEHDDIAPAPLTLRARLWSLPAGTYEAEAVVSAPTAVNSPQVIEVTLTVTAEAPSYELTVTRSPSGGGTVTRSPDQPAYAPGTVVTLTATPAVGYRFAGWSGDAGGASNPLAVTMDRDRSITASYQLKPPVLSGPAASAGAIDLSWAFEWPCDNPFGGGCLASSLDHYELEESTTSTTSGFDVILVTNTTRASPFEHALERGPGTYHYRVRAFGRAWASPYSNVITVTVSSSGPAAPSGLSASVSGATVTLRWTDNASDEDGFTVHASTSSSFTSYESFDVPANQTSTELTDEEPPQTWYFRVLAHNEHGTSAPSNTATATTSAPTLLRFVNNTGYAVISLKIGGTEQFPVAPQGLLPGQWYQVEVPPGTYSFFMANGFWDGSARFTLYTYSGQASVSAGQTREVVFTDPPVSQILSRFKSSQAWDGLYFDQSGTPHTQTFVFHSNGTYQFLRDGSQVASGVVSLVGRYPGGFYIEFEANGHVGTLWETFGYFVMRNGPASWPLIDYYPR